MATENLGALSIILGVDTRQLERDLKRSRNKLETFATKADAIGRKMSRVGRGLTKAVTLPAIAAAGFSLNEYRKFNQAMTESLAIMGDVSRSTRKEMEALALTLSTESTYAANELAKAYYFLASAGFTVEESMKALPVVTRFAQAGMFTLDHATSLLADSTKALGMWTKDATENQRRMVRVSDVLVKANTLANATTEQFASALTNRFAAALRVVNKDVEEGAAVLAAFAEQGRKGEKAGLAGAIVLRDLQRAALKNVDTFKQMNIRVFDTQGEMRNMADILLDLENRFEGMSGAQRKSTLMMLGFQERSQLNLLTLIGMSDRVRKFEEDLRNAGGTTKTVAEQQLESLQAKLTILWHRIKKVAIAFAETMLPVVMKVMKKIEEFVKWLTELSDEHKELLIRVVAVAAALGPLLIVLGGIITALGSFAAGLGAMSVAGGAAAAITATLTASIGILVPLLLAAGGVLTLMLLSQKMYNRTLDDTSEAIAQFKKELNFQKERNNIIKLGKEIDKLQKQSEDYQKSIQAKGVELESAQSLLQEDKARLKEAIKLANKMEAQGRSAEALDDVIAKTNARIKDRIQVVTKLERQYKALQDGNLEQKKREYDLAKALFAQAANRVRELEKIREIRARTGALTGREEKSIQKAKENMTALKEVVADTRAEYEKIAEATKATRIEEEKINRLSASQKALSELMDPLEQSVLQEIDPFGAAMNKIGQDADAMIEEINRVRDNMEGLVAGGEIDLLFDAEIQRVRDFAALKRHLLEKEREKELQGFIYTENRKRLIRLKEERDRMLMMAKNEKQRMAIEKAYFRKRKVMLTGIVKGIASGLEMPSLNKSVAAVEKGSEADFRKRHGLDEETLKYEEATARNTEAISIATRKLAREGVTKIELKKLDLKGI